MQGEIFKQAGPYANLRTDTGFKHVFCDRQNKEVLKTMLNTFLPVDKKIRDFEYADREVEGFTPEGKGVHMDLRCVDEQGCDFIVEMQNYKEEAFFKRCLLYCARLYSSKLQVGKPYKDLMPVYLVAFMTIPFEEKEFNIQEDGISCYRFSNIYSGKHTVDDISIIFVQLYKVKHSLDECTTDQERYMYYLWNMCNMSECPEAAKGGHCENLFRSSEIAEFDNEKKLRYYDEMRTEMDYMVQVETYYKHGKAEGLAEGRAEGRAKGLDEGAIIAKRNIANDMLKRGYDIVSVSEITGLSAEEIGSLSIV